MKETAGMKDFFSVNSFERKICEKCGSSYWTRDPERRTCGDPPCDPYSFIGSSDLKRKTVDEMRESFIDYFRGSHGFVNPYPVVPRWREDVLLVNASIYDFQPHVTGGYAEPPQNPLVMSQPCIRMLDVDLVGMTGRHLTSFEMMCHDAFNKPGHYVYWKDETLSYCYSFLTESLGVDGDIITFKEKPWSGGGNGGNAVEVLVRGLEVATLVFMDMKEDPEGEFEIDGLRYSRMDRTIIDTGYGLERLAWLTTGTPTIYDTVFERPINFIYTRLGLKEPSDRVRSLN
ncbi:MAG: alanine--tRNA ligase-related protein, partial [Candidatus Thermoplasmatota archaeon]|nr:alanine--tRNA ligase-related protein [Candidatus Thermoplasmatota archaeon]